MAVRPGRIGLLGGSFDPVHTAHIALAKSARSTLDLDQVQLIPAANPWQREPLKASSQHRLAMLDLAIKRCNWLAINTIEIDRGGKTYTVDTLRNLPLHNQYYWIMGSDQLRNFCTWQSWQEITERVVLAVAHRPGSPPQAPRALQRYLDMLGREIVSLPLPVLEISATEIRDQLAQGLTPSNNMLDDDVMTYISTHGLYQAPSGS